MNREALDIFRNMLLDEADDYIEKANICLRLYRELPGGEN